VRIGENEITGNNNGLFGTGAGVQLLSFNDNHIFGNTTNGTPTGPAGHG
jgi:hypothetical protein